MTDRTPGETARLTRLALRRGVRRGWSAVLSRLRRVTSSSRAPGRLLIAPQDIRTSDPTVAADIYAGYFVFDGKAVNTQGRSPFGLLPPNQAWAEALAGFGWLRHLRAADTALARVNARALVADWIALQGRSRGGVGWNAPIVARRLISWLSQSPLILDGADGFFYRRFMRSIARQAVVLRHVAREDPSGETRLLAAIALTEFGLSADGFDRVLRQASQRLIAEIGAQILPDGGHVSRHPGRLVDLLLDLLPLRQAFLAAGIAPPPALLNAIDRMMPMVRTFRHGDGTLALFNGMGATKFDALASVLAHDDSSGSPLSNASHSGYGRLERNGSVLIVDCGPPPPVAYAREAHAGTLAFEFSVGTQRVVVNCGTPDAGPAIVREAARLTAAHSTLVLGDRSSSRFSPEAWLGQRLGRTLYSGPRHVPAEQSQSDLGPILVASHDGYLLNCGMIHRRRLLLAKAGDRLEGEDGLVREARPAPGPGRRTRASAEPLDVAIRFHMHYALRLQTIRAGAAVLIAFPTGDAWEFEAGGSPISIEESIYLASTEGPRRTEQLVVRAPATDGLRVTWSLTRKGPPG